MDRNRKATSSRPPDTDDLDADWKDVPGSSKRAEPPQAQPDANEKASERTTAVPPRQPYEDYARKLTAGLLSDTDARRALSAPSLPRIDTPSDELESTTDLFADLQFSLVNAEPSGPHAIPLDVDTDLGNTTTADRPTPVHGYPTPLVEQSGETADDFFIPVSLGGTDDEQPPDQPDGFSFEDPPPIQRSSSPIEGLSSPSERSSSPEIVLQMPERGDALDLVNSRTAPSEPPTKAPAADPLLDIRDRYALGDFTGALALAEDLLAEHPDDTEAQRYAQSCRDILIQMYAARLGSTAQVPRVIVSPEEIRWLTLDHRAGFLLSCIDGRSSIEEILDVSGMPALEALRILYTLLQQQIIDVAPRRGG